MEDKAVSLPALGGVDARQALDVIVPGEAYSPEQLKIICETVMPPNPTNSEVAQFVAACQATGLSPFNKQLYAIRRKGKLTIQTGIDGYVTMAQRTKDYAGADEPWFDVDPVKAETLREEGHFVHPKVCKVKVHRKSGGFAVGMALWSEYAQFFYNRREDRWELAETWKQMSFTMLEKCAFAKGLRKLFGADVFAGVYVEEEMAENRGTSTAVRMGRPDAQPENETPEQATEPEPPAQPPETPAEAPPEPVVEVVPPEERLQTVPSEPEPPSDEEPSRVQAWFDAIETAESKQRLKELVEELQRAIVGGAPFTADEKRQLKVAFKTRSTQL